MLVIAHTVFRKTIGKCRRHSGSLRLKPVEPPLVWSDNFFEPMDSSAELRAKRAGFLARFDILVPKFSKQERSVLEVSYHHQQQKDSFRLDRIERVRHHILDPVPDNTVADETKDDGLFFILSKFYDKVKHRRHLTSEEFIVEAKKGNLTRCPVLPTV